MLQSHLDPGRAADLRAMLVAQATPVATSARNRRLVLAGGLAAAVVAIGAVVVAVYPDRTTPSWSAWTAVPQAGPPLSAPPRDIDEWASKCTDLGVGGVGIEGVPADRKAAAGREVIVDRRGGFTYCVDVALGHGTARDPLVALSGLKEGGPDGLNGMEATVYDKPFDPPRAGDVLVLGGTEETAPANSPEGIQAFQMYGLSGPAVTSIDLVLANGLAVTASLRHGIWGLWWPSDRGGPAGYKLRVHTAAGVTVLDPSVVRLQFR
jgi:hypothetical protein